MVDVGAKPVTRRAATARARVLLPESVAQHLMEHASSKGPVFTVAQLAGILGAKKTPDLIPLCHTLPLTHVSVQLELKDNAVAIVCAAETSGQTGVEMEALVGASIAALTVYDMCKALSHNMVLSDIALVSKRGGSSAPDM